MNLLCPATFTQQLIQVLQVTDTSEQFLTTLENVRVYAQINNNWLSHWRRYHDNMVYVLRRPSNPKLLQASRVSVHVVDLLKHMILTS